MRKQLHDRIISLRREILADKTNLTSPLFIEVSVSSQESERWCVCVLAGEGIQGAHPARAPPKIGKNMICWRKIMIFHMKYPKHFRASLRSAQFF